jgi:hypothetical protein
VPPPAKLQPALLGGLFLGVLTALPIVNFANCCCLWLLAGGMVAAWAMQQSHPTPIRTSDGLVVGVLAGVVGAVVYLVVSLPLNAVLAPVYEALRGRLLQNAQDMPPELRQAIETMGFGPPSLVLSFLTNVLLGSVFAGAGGVLGAVVFRRRIPAGVPPPAPVEPWAPARVMENPVTPAPADRPPVDRGPMGEDAEDAAPPPSPPLP